MVWHGLNAAGVELLEFIYGKMNQIKYLDILKINQPITYEKFGEKENSILK